MSRFSDRLKLSVSAAALMGGSLIAASSARAVTITGTQTSASVTNVVDDVTIAGTGVISPNGLFVNSLIGDLVNNGLIEGEVTTAAALTSGSADFLIRTTAFDLNSGMTGDITNNGTIAASATGSASYTDAGAANPTHDSDALAHAIDINGGLVGDFTNNNDILSDASNSLTVTRGTEATPAGAPVNINDDVYANAQGVEIDSMTGTFTNTSPLTIASTADSSSSHSVVAQGGPADVDIIDLDVQATSTSVYIRGGTYAFDNEGTISAQASGDVGVDILAVATAGVADVDADVSRVYPQAYPVYLRGTVTGFTNSGTISGDLSSTADVNIVATGAAAADVDITNAVWGYLTTVHVRDLDGNFENSGTISATTDSSLQATVSASSANGAATIGVDDFASVGVYGGQYAVYIGSLDGTFTNSSALTIEGTSSGSADYDLSAQGASAVIDIEDVYVYQSMRAVEIDGGTYAVNNSGTISSTADSSATVNAAATGTDGLALIYVSQSNFASASGFHAGGTSVTDFSNSGTISSTAATDLAVVAAASGETQAYVTVDTTTMRIRAVSISVRWTEVFPIHRR
ncbi:MAG: beta strand repeat-containing protein [Alphaproteobacteria bacterium]